MPDVNAPTLITNARVVTTASNYTVVGDETLVIVTDTSSARTITLPSTTVLPNGFILTIKDGSNGAGINPITIDGDGSETIDGATTQKILSNLGVMTIQVSDSTNGKWSILSAVGVYTAKYTTANDATYTILNSDEWILSTRSSTGTQTITLPLASSINIPSGKLRFFTITDKGGNAGTNNITLSCSGADTISGSATFVMNGNYESRDIMTEGTAWYLV